jgi:hypothetical protein
MKRRALLFLFLLGGVAACVIALLWMLASILFDPKGQRTWCIAIAFDQLGNAVSGGSEDETISSRAERERKEGRKWACVLCHVLDWLEKDHCKGSAGT